MITQPLINQNEELKLTRIKSIGEKIAESLKQAGILDIKDLAQAKKTVLTSIKGIGEKKAISLINEAKNYLLTRIQELDPKQHADQEEEILESEEKSMEINQEKQFLTNENQEEKSLTNEVDFEVFSRDTIEEIKDNTTDEKGEMELTENELIENGLDENFTDDVLEDEIMIDEDPFLNDLLFNPSTDPVRKSIEEFLEDDDNSSLQENLEIPSSNTFTSKLIEKPNNKKRHAKIKTLKKHLSFGNKMPKLENSLSSMNTSPSLPQEQSINETTPQPNIEKDLLSQEELELKNLKQQEQQKIENKKDALQLTLTNSTYEKKLKKIEKLLNKWRYILFEPSIKEDLSNSSKIQFFMAKPLLHDKTILIPLIRVSLEQDTGMDNTTYLVSKHSVRLIDSSTSSSDLISCDFKFLYSQQLALHEKILQGDKKYIEKLSSALGFSLKYHKITMQLYSNNNNDKNKNNNKKVKIYPFTLHLTNANVKIANNKMTYCYNRKYNMYFHSLNGNLTSLKSFLDYLEKKLIAIHFLEKETINSRNKEYLATLHRNLKITSWISPFIFIMGLSCLFTLFLENIPFKSLIILGGVMTFIFYIILLLGVIKTSLSKRALLKKTLLQPYFLRKPFLKREKISILRKNFKNGLFEQFLRERSISNASQVLTLLKQFTLDPYLNKTKKHKNKQNNEEKKEENENESKFFE
ncbi:MAG: helix-hairpin-helix domain-containing protein [Promethearchaeota archaeon]